jgi:hypothetical protein
MHRFCNSVESFTKTIHGIFNSVELFGKTMHGFQKTFELFCNSIESFTKKFTVLIKSEVENLFSEDNFPKTRTNYSHSFK